MSARGAKVWIVWALLVVSAGLLVCLIMLAPWARARGEAFWSLTVYRALRVVCHQLPERSFYLAGHPLAVCARCFGIYAGFALSAFMYPALRSLTRTTTPARVWLIVALVPLAIDFVLGFFHLWENSHWSRALTGALAGAVAVFYVVPGLMDLMRISAGRHFHRPSFRP